MSGNGGKLAVYIYKIIPDSDVMERCVFLSVYTAAIFSVQPAATARQSVLRECKSQNGLVG